MNAIKVLTRLTIGLLLVGGILYFSTESNYNSEGLLRNGGPVNMIGIGAGAAGAWSFIALLAALVIKSIKGESK